MDRFLVKLLQIYSKVKGLPLAVPLHDCFYSTTLPSTSNALFHKLEPVPSEHHDHRPNIYSVADTLDILSNYTLALTSMMTITASILPSIPVERFLTQKTSSSHRKLNNLEI